jgi:carboxyl-terminal processing protease
VLQEVPEELKARTDTSGEASLRGHLKAQGDEQTGSQSYIPAGSEGRQGAHAEIALR